MFFSVFSIQIMALLILLTVVLIKCVVCGTIPLEGVKDIADNEIANPFEEAIIKNKISMESGYVEVRPGVSMFWWLFHANGQRDNAQNKPIILWVQGGPGLPASGIGNFLEMGPLDIHLKPRNHTWVKGHNLLLIDSPAGTGFSKIADESLLVKADKEIVTDLVNTVIGFLKVHQEFKKTPWHIFSQSYGGKIAPKLGYRLHQAKKNGKIEINLKTVAIGSGFVDPKETITSAVEYMFEMGLLDINDYSTLKSTAAAIKSYIKQREFRQAFTMNLEKFDDLDPSVYQIYKNNINEPNHYREGPTMELIMNKYVKPTLNNTISPDTQWEYLKSEVYLSLSDNMMLSSTRYVERLLNETAIRVVIYNGNLDAVTPMSGCVNWVHRLRWAGKEDFYNQKRIKLDGINNGFFKDFNNLSLWWIFGSGHWVPNDNPAAMKQILEYVVNT